MNEPLQQEIRRKGLWTTFYDKDVLLAYEQLNGRAQEIKDSELSVLDKLLGPVIQPNHLHRSVDIGTCTGRYLTWAHKIGVKDIHGIDQSPAAIKFCEENLPFKVTLHLGSCAQPEVFSNLEQCSLLTMMMGTINHLSPQEVVRFFANVGPCTAPNSVLIFSTWRASPYELEIYAREHIQEIESSFPIFRSFPQELPGFKLLDRIETPWLDIWVCERRS